MLRTAARLAFLFAALAATFVGGALVAILRGWGSPVVHLAVVNNSGVEVRSVVLDYESCGYKSTLVGGILPPQAQSHFKFLSCGEGGYRLRALLANGSELIGAEGYVESGYSITEFVEPTLIRSEVRSLRY